MKRLQLLFVFITLLYSCSDSKTTKEKIAKNIFYVQAKKYRDAGLKDSAVVYFNKAKDLFVQENDSLGIAKCLVNLGIIATEKGDYFSGQEFSLNAFPYLDTISKEKDVRATIMSGYNNLGQATYRLKDYEGSLKFYDLAIKFSENPLHLGVCLNSKANSYRELENYDQALKLYSQALKLTYPNQQEYARVLTNIPFTKWLQNPVYNAAPDLLRALKIREQVNDYLGQNSSYSHLSDYYKKSHPDSALIYALKMYKVANSVNSPDDELNALQKLIELGNPRDTKQHFEHYLKLSDSLETARNGAKNQFTLIRYDAEKSKADFLQAQAENIQKQNNILRLYILLIVLVSILILGYFLFRKRQKRLQQEKELEVKNTELKYVKKTHDRVANRVYNLMIEVDNTAELDRVTVADKLEVIYKISRDLSYESNDLDLGIEFPVHLSKMLRSYSSDAVEIFIEQNEENLWKEIKKDAKSEVFDILQELMTNMAKHSTATEVTIGFEREKNQMFIYYIDNGIGISKEVKSGNGFSNMGNRINNIGGAINFGDNNGKGLKVDISFPAS